MTQALAVDPGSVHAGEVLVSSEAGPELAAIPKIAYLCAQYPAVSHTFILREVNALRELGVEIDTFSIRRAGTEHLLAQADHDAFQSTYTILPPRWGAVLGGHLKLVLRSPRTYFSTLARALRSAPPGLRGRLWQLFYFVEAVVLWRECERRGLRHIHVHLANVAADVGLLASTLGSAVEPEHPWSWSFTMHGPTEFFEVGRFRLAEKLRSARFVVCISDYARSQLMSLCEPELWERLHVVHCGIPMERFTRSGAGDRGEQTGILCIGRLVPEKGQAVLLEAVAQLAERGRRVAVTLAGEGPSRPALERMAGRLGIASQTTFLGAVGQEQIRDLYESASIFCLPSFAEGVPCVLMEAMAMELPVLSTRITGIPELIDDTHNGLLVAPGRVDELAGAIERLIADPSRARELGVRGRETVAREFDVEHTAEQLRCCFASELAGLDGRGRP